MSYEIFLTDRCLKIIHLIDRNLNSLTGWGIQFDDGKEAIVCISEGEWIQCNGDWLNATTLIAIGQCIENAVLRKNSRTADSYFYDMMLSEEV